ncbi:something about silencing protein 10 isoform X2 [Corythoichthys intestinalis]|uniref:something about silencing protein 10 isoform X2 n=1 Tax=Corythoichthys intestinalis TaxID=161448 RepID=UPI0025A50CCF|nr:something about silencing protein 10 isoform X2 [Corythoichthys intestinalis]XP_061814641.1 something about silencing protein 10-like [Nerophis lumbriciformis]
MVRALRRKKFQRPKNQQQYDEGDPEGYKSMAVPDKISKDKIDEFHDEKIEKLLASGVDLHSDEEELDDEEEVMALDDSETDDDDDEDEEDNEEDEGTDMESDLEGKNEEELPNELAWGTKKKMFYDSDYMATKGKSQEELEAADEEEEEEAKKIQKRMAEQLSEEDYDLNLFQEFAKEDQTEATVVEKEKIVKDLKQMSHKEKMKLLKKESPELLELIQDFKAKLTELKEQLQPLVQMVKDKKIPPGKGADYLKTKQQLYLNYCTNISFYLVLKAKRIPAHNHPVIERLLTYRNLINELSSVDARLEPQYKKLLAAREEDEITRKPAAGKKDATTARKDKDSGKAVSETAVASDSDLDEEAALRFYREVEERMKLKKKSKQRKAQEGNEDVNEEEELDPEAKRSITYQMAKNKGLTPKRKKIDRNPRVKHREKYRRAKIRRKGQVREVRREETRYSGELSGIRAGVKKSIKLK